MQVCQKYKVRQPYLRCKYEVRHMTNRGQAAHKCAARVPGSANKMYLQRSTTPQTDHGLYFSPIIIPYVSSHVGWDVRDV